MSTYILKEDNWVMSTQKLKKDDQVMSALMLKKGHVGNDDSNIEKTISQRLLKY